MFTKWRGATWTTTNFDVVRSDSWRAEKVQLTLRPLNASFLLHRNGSKSTTKSHRKQKSGSKTTLSYLNPYFLLPEAFLQGAEHQNLKDSQTDTIWFRSWSSLLVSGLVTNRIAEMPLASIPNCLPVLLMRLNKTVLLFNQVTIYRVFV